VEHVWDARLAIAISTGIPPSPVTSSGPPLSPLHGPVVSRGRSIVHISPLGTYISTRRAHHAELCTTVAARLNRGLTLDLSGVVRPHPATTPRVPARSGVVALSLTGTALVGLDNTRSAASSAPPVITSNFGSMMTCETADT
jgi:hypothetical protein